MQIEKEREREEFKYFHYYDNLFLDFFVRFFFDCWLVVNWQERKKAAQETKGGEGKKKNIKKKKKSKIFNFFFKS